MNISNGCFRWSVEIDILKLCKCKKLNPGNLTEAESILGNLFPLLSTVRRTLYPLVGLANGDIFKEVTKGDHKGENRYMRNIKKYFIPYWD